MQSVRRILEESHPCTLCPVASSWPPRQSQPAGNALPGLAKGEAAKFKLGLVTYNVPKDWDLPTILKVCQEVGIAAVECRTTHKHGVEPTLSPQQREA